MSAKQTWLRCVRNQHRTQPDSITQMRCNNLACTLDNRQMPLDQL
jgi:hypothetical protein